MPKLSDEEFMQLLEELNDPLAAKRREVVYVLGKSGDPRAFEHLLNALYDDDLYTRWRAIDAFGANPDPRAVEHVKRGLMDAEEDVRIATIEALSNYPREQVEYELGVVFRKDDNKFVRGAAEKALKKLGVDTEKIPEDPVKKEDAEETAKPVESTSSKKEAQN